MAYRKRPGVWRTPGPPPKAQGRKVRDILRRHARLLGLTLPEAFQAAWGFDKPRAVWSRMNRKQPMSPWHVAQAADALKLDPDDRRELMLQGARECGWDV